MLISFNQLISSHTDGNKNHQIYLLYSSVEKCSANLWNPNLLNWISTRSQNYFSNWKWNYLCKLMSGHILKILFCQKALIVFCLCPGLTNCPNGLGWSCLQTYPKCKLGFNDRFLSTIQNHKELCKVGADKLIGDVIPEHTTVNSNCSCTWLWSLCQSAKYSVLGFWLCWLKIFLLHSFLWNCVLLLQLNCNTVC